MPISYLIEKLVQLSAFDGLITIDKCQYIGIFAGSGVGQSTMMGISAKHR